MDEKNNKNAAMRIMEALSGVDEDLLERCGYSAGTAAPKKRRRRKAGAAVPMWKWARACAAVLCLLLVGAVSWGGYQVAKDNGSDGFSYSGGSANEEAADDFCNGTENAQVQQAAGEVSEGILGAEDCLPEDLGGALAGTESQKESELPKSEDSSLETPDTEESLDGSSGLPEKDSAEALPNTVALSEDEARNWEKLGSYIPVTLPQGYVFEGASYHQDTGRLVISWTRGMDLIIVSIGEADSAETVDVGKPETYDERLYEIPYGSSVPPEYRESFGDPVFALEDLGLEIVKSRIISHNDSGDTDTPRGSFSVLYPDGILLRFNGRGTPEQIWEMFAP